jgi:hypothetical protein
VEERDDGRAPEATNTDAVAARTRALVEESRQLLQRLEHLIGRNAGRDGDHADHAADAEGAGDAENAEDAEDAEQS